MTRKLTDAQVAEAVATYTGGTITIKDLASRYGINYASMRGLLHRRGVIDSEDHATRILRVRRRHGEAVLAALPASLAGQIDEPACGPRHVALTVEGKAVELIDGGWDDLLHGVRLRERIAALPESGALLAVWLDRVHRLNVARIAEHIVAMVVGSRGTREYRVVWGDGEVIAAGRGADAFLDVVPPLIYGIHR